jgi:acyl-coenzyme A thioesterase PaaI-like protein
VLSQDPRPTTFENHPGLRGREPEARALADQLRRLIRLSVSTAPSPDETAQLTARLRDLADELESHLPRDPLPRFIQPEDDGPPKDVPLGGAMPYDVVVGPFNPIALPVELDFEPPKALGRAVFDVTYEGAPGCVHGAILAATFDIILTAANAVEGAVGPTVRLALQYLRPTLTNEEAVFEGWVTEVTDRRIFSKGRIVQGGVVTVEADGEFAIFNRDGVQRMADSRRVVFDAELRRQADVADAPRTGSGGSGGVDTPDIGAVPTGE